MKNKLIFLSLLICMVINTAQSQIYSDVETHRKYFVGSTLFVPYGLFVKPSPKYYQLNFGYRFDTENTITLEAITWKYLNPLGIPYGPDYETEETQFPGAVQSYGMGLSYHRFIWKGIYGQVHSTAFKQNYMSQDDEKMQSGFQLFNTLRFGYHFKLFQNRVFIEPSVCATWWPVNTNMPQSFQIEEDKWNNYFLFEPGLHFGINF